MSFDSLSFVLLLFGSIILFHLLKEEYRKYVLLIASAIFYLVYSFKYFVLLFLLSLMTFFLSHFLDRANRKIILIAYLFIVIGVLCFYKYASLFSLKNVLFPLGISFYTFQMIGYFVDVYKGELSPCKDFFDFLLLILFFPKLSSGPIEDSASFLKQTKKMKGANEKQIIEGFTLLLVGLFKKLMIANRIASLIDPIYTEYARYNGFAVFLALVLYAFEIYADFSGYSDMAVGCGKLFGIELSENFNHPYLCANFDDFWRRWHISLTRWFRKYVYFSLSGNRKGRVRTYINIMVVFLLSGLWHGNQFHYLIWGLLNGILVIFSKSLSQKNILNKTIRRILSLVLIVFCWSFFAAPSTLSAFAVLGRLFSTEGIFLKSGLDFYIAIVLCILLMVAEIFDEKRNLLTVFCEKPFYVRTMVYLLLLFSVILFGYYGKMSSSSFIYFQF